MPVSPISRARRVPLWSLREDVLVEVDETGAGAVLLSRWGEQRLPAAGPAAVQTLRRMTLGPVQLENAVAGADRRRLDDLLTGLQHVLVRSLGTEDGMGPLLSVVPVGRQARFTPRPVPAGAPVRLSRLAALRSSRGGLVLSSPVAAHRVVLHQPVARAVAAALGTIASPADVAAALALPAGLVDDVIAYLAGAGMLVGLAAADPERVDGPGDGPVLRLFRPDWGAVLAADPPLTAAVEQRRSWSRFGPEPLTARQLGELLFRSAGARAGDHRPYPPGPRELCLYPVIERCAGIPPAVYRYDPDRHALATVTGEAGAVAGLLDAARLAGGLPAPPPLLIAITARLDPPAGAYAGTLTSVGALLQTLSLVATAMGLAPGTVVPDDEDDRTVRALHLDERHESDLGELVLGARPVGQLDVIDRPEAGMNGGDRPK